MQYPGDIVVVQGKLSNNAAFESILPKYPE